jgi:hypothetical protein
MHKESDTVLQPSALTLRKISATESRKRRDLCPCWGRGVG